MEDRRTQQLLRALLAYAEQGARDRAHELETERAHRKRLEKILARALESLPDLTRQATERATYELRAARWEAHQAGAPSGLPLPPAPPAPSFSDATREHTKPFMLTHNDATYVKASGVLEAARKLWPVFTILAAAAASGYSWLVAHGIIK